MKGQGFEPFWVAVKINTSDWSLRSALNRHVCDWLHYTTLFLEINLFYIETLDAFHTNTYRNIWKQSWEMSEIGL